MVFLNTYSKPGGIMRNDGPDSSMLLVHSKIQGHKPKGLGDNNF